LTGLTVALIESGKGDEAISQLESLIKTEPNRADLRAQLGELLMAKSPEKALEQYQAAAKLEPSQPNHRIGVGSALVKLRRFQEAVNLLRETLAQNPKEEVAYFAHTNLATAHFELDDFANAAREFHLGAQSPARPETRDDHALFSRNLPRQARRLRAGDEGLPAIPHARDFRESARNRKSQVANALTAEADQRRKRQEERIK
jgi:predicted Zn-dependent protease